MYLDQDCEWAAWLRSREGCTISSCEALAVGAPVRWDGQGGRRACTGRSREGRCKESVAALIMYKVRDGALPFRAKAILAWLGH